MTIVIRTDSSTRIGIGHVMRCLTLADELRQSGATIIFICRSFEGHCISLIQDRGYIVHKLQKPSDPQKEPKDSPPSHYQWLGVTWKQDAIETLHIFRRQNINVSCLIIDHYALDYRWQQFFRQYVDKIMIIDDLADRKHICDLLLDQTYSRKETDYRKLVPETCMLLLGSSYALLRTQFKRKRQEAIERRTTHKSIKRILICMGGTDPDNATSIVLQGLERVSFSDQIQIDVVLGDDAPHFTEVKKMVSESALEIKIYSNVHNMADLMLQADLAIGAGGTTCWERCCLGLPSLVVVTAVNQQGIVDILGDIDAVINIGNISSLVPEIVTDSLHNILSDTEHYQRIIEHSFSITDGSGAHKVSQKILTL